MDNNLSQSVIVEIRAGTGGEEAGLFANDLFQMYSKYAHSQGWKLTVLELKPTMIGGLKQVVFEIKGKNAYSKMKYEAGVHRVQRIPKTERKGRIHTSTATVAVLPKPKIRQIEIKPEDLRIETFRSSGPGGQHMQKTESAVRITHLPSGITASSQSSRSQAQNKENAMRILEAYLLERLEKKKLEQQIQQRKSQIKMAKRAEKTRTYNFPQNRMTDHRIKKSWHNLDKILEGDLDKVVDTLAKKLK